ncbi:MAG: hypothetical protein ACYC3I_15405 [Gemmataceae bacterium]
MTFDDLVSPADIFVDANTFCSYQTARPERIMSAFLLSNLRGLAPAVTEKN